MLKYYFTFNIPSVELTGVFMISQKIRKIFWKSTIPAAFFIGCAARLWFYLLNDSFWRDETKLLLNVAQHSFLDLLHPLQYGQESPIAFLWLLRVLWLLGANGELAVRGISLVAGLLSLYYFHLLIKHVFSDRKTRFFSLLLFAISPGIILFAGLAKQYSIDLLIATILLNSYCHHFISSNSNDITMGIKAYILVALAPWLSLPSVFIITAIGAGLLLRNKRRYLRPVLLLLAIGCASFILEWVWVLHRSLAIQGFAFFNYSSRGGWWWDFAQVFFAYTGPNSAFSLIVGMFFAALLMLLGFSEARRRHGLSLVILLLLPLILAWGASLVKVYPSWGRCLLFATPGIYLLVGYGMTFIFHSNGTSLIKGAVILVLLIVPCLKETLRSYVKPVGGVREALQFITERQQNGDVVVCDSYSAPSIAYYRLCRKPSATMLNFALEPIQQIEGNSIDENLPYTLCGSTYLSHRVWLVSETTPYARQWIAKKPLRFYFKEFLGRIAGRRKVEQPFKKDPLLEYWRNTLNKLSAERRVVNRYITNRVQVYGFNKPNNAF